MTILQKTLVTATVAVLAGTGIYEARQASHADVLIPVVRAFQTANNGQQLGDPSRLLPYAQTPDQQRALQKWIQRFPSPQK